MKMISINRNRSSSLLLTVLGLLLLSQWTSAEKRFFVPNFNTTTNNKTLCERLHPEEMPEECSCREPGPFSVVVECLKTFNSTYFNDTIGVKIDLDPCNKDGSRLSLDITEKAHNIDYPITGIRAGEERNIPIPGLSIAVPTVGNVGVDAAVLITGNPDSLTLKVGLNACIALAQKTLCASNIPGLNYILPWYILSGTYTFGDVCNANATSSSTTTTTPLLRSSVTSPLLVAKE